MSQNGDLKLLLGNLEEIALSAKKESDFKPVYKKLREFIASSGPIKFNHSTKITISLLFFFSACIFSYLYFTDWEIMRLFGFWGIIIILGLAAGFATPLFMLSSDNDLIKDLSDLIFVKDTCFDNDIKEMSVAGKGELLYDQLYQDFGEFRNRGDEDREITRMVRGEYHGEEVSFRFKYYVFKYVVVTYTSNGKTITRHTETKYRYGLLTKFDLVKNIAVVSSGGSHKFPVAWSTASEKFDKTFWVGAADEMTANKFLSPTVVLAFEDMDKYFEGLNVEINGKGEMNIAFSNSDVMDAGRKYSVADPDNFEKEIESFLSLPRLKKVLKFIELLYKYNDSNF